MLAVILLTTLNSFAQFKISGRVQNHKRPDSLVLNIPFVYGYYSENDIKIPIDGTGNFNFTVPVKSQKFATLRYKNKMSTLLLSEGKSLSILMDSTGMITSFDGNAAEENKILYRADLNGIPFFLQGDYKNNPYAQLSAPELQEKLVKPWFKIRDENIERVWASKLSVHDKKLIAAEITYQAYGELSYFAHGVIYTNKKLVNEFSWAIYDNLKPDPEIFPAGPWYYYYAGDYINYLDSKIFADYGPDDERSKAPFLNTYHISLDSAMTLVKQYGNSYIHWFLIRQYFTKNVAEQYLAQSIWKECRDKDFSRVKPLMHDFILNFPNSPNLDLLQDKVNKLEVLYKQNESNKDIHVFDGYDKVNSIYEVVNSFKGKVIYLDVWGTWCGPCKKELSYNPQLKQHFKDKDIVFVYLDMDENSKDAEWRKFIKINGLTGIHLRKNNPEIQQFWEELLPGKKERLYPSYFIFDKTGKLVQADTKQPSDGAVLYTELEKYL